MTTVKSNESNFIRRALIGLFAIAVLFNLGLTAQVLSVGLAYFYDPIGWTIHVWLVRGYSGLSLVLLGLVFWLPVPARVRNLTASLPVLLGLQFLTIHLNSSLPIAVLHPLIGFTLFNISTALVHATQRLVYPERNGDSSQD